MQKSQTKNFYNKKLHLKIFILLDKRRKEYYLSYFQSKDTYTKYKNHMSCKYLQTKEWICSLREENVRPCFLILEEIDATKYQAVQHVIAWNKRLTEENYCNISKRIDSTINDELYEETEEIYRDISKKDLTELLDCSHCCIKTYGKYSCSNAGNNEQIVAKYSSKKRRIEIVVTEEEYQNIAKQAKYAKKKIATYIRLSALHPQFLIIDYQYLDAVAKETRDLNMYIQNFILTILNTTQYFPSELEDIQNSQKKIQELWNNARKEIRKHHQKFIKQMNGVEKNDC